MFPLLILKHFYHFLILAHKLVFKAHGESMYTTLYEAFQLIKVNNNNIYKLITINEVLLNLFPKKSFTSDFFKKMKEKQFNKLLYE